MLPALEMPFAAVLAIHVVTEISVTQVWQQEPYCRANKMRMHVQAIQ